MANIMSRHEVAHYLGRRVSRGEYERIFSRLGVVKDPKGARFVRRAASPKALRKRNKT